MFQKTAAGQREVLRRQHNDGAEGQFPGDDDGHTDRHLRGRGARGHGRASCATTKKE